MKIILTIFLIYSCQFLSSQRLNDDIIFENHTKTDSLKIEKIEKLVSKSKIIKIEDCNSSFRRWSFCLKDYLVIYLYDNEPILIDKKSWNFIDEMRSDSTEKTTTYIIKTSIFVTDWKNRNFISKEVWKKNTGINTEYKNVSVDFKEIENIIKAN